LSLFFCSTDMRGRE